MSNPNLVVVETMPEGLRESHNAARNSGVFPFNGAMREVMLREDAAYLVNADPDWSSIVEDADIISYISDKSSVFSWETVASYVQTFDNGDDLGACDVELRVGEAYFEGEPTGVWFVCTVDDAGGSDDFDDSTFPSYENAVLAAQEFAEDHNEANSDQDAVDYLEAQEQARAIENANGEWACYWSCLKESRAESRYATEDAAKAAVSLAKHQLERKYPGNNLLCGYQVRQLVDGEWVQNGD